MTSILLCLTVPAILEFLCHKTEVYKIQALERVCKFIIEGCFCTLAENLFLLYQNSSFTAGLKLSL